MKRNRGYYLSSAIFILCFFQAVSASAAGALNAYGIQSDNPYVVSRFVQDGKLIDQVIVPGRPPEFYRAPLAIVPESSAATGTQILSSVPAFDWSYGCSATAAAMMFGYYDNTGYPNLYLGPTNGGVCPQTNAVWGSGECPLSATHLGLDGRAIKGHVDDYWITYGSSLPDPFIGNWAEHAQGECTGDFMGTNQSSKSNTDGATSFWYYNDGSPLYDYTGVEPELRDGCHGMKLFFESRGYTVTGNYTQLIMGSGGNTLGFTFAQYKQEIDAGRPVLIQVEGHSMLGYGYDDTGSLIYLHDTWDYGDHSMTWGGTYSGMQQWGVTVFIPAPSITNPILSVTPYSLGIGSGSGTTSFSVSNTGGGTLSWTAAVTSVGSWLTITSGDSGTDSGTINCNFTANISTSPRTATIRVTASGATGSPMDVTVAQGSILNELLAASFAGSGLWIYNTAIATWTQVSQVTPENILYSGTTLYVDFGVYGIYKWDGTTWTRITQSNPENIVASGSVLYGDFGTSGIWMWSGGSETAWTRITQSNPENIVASGSVLYGDFGASGIWMWSGGTETAWTRITQSNSENIVASGSVLYGDFGASGIWMWSGGTETAWTRITQSNSENIVASGSVLYGDFGASGIWFWSDGDELAWTRITPSNPDKMAISN